MAEGLPHILILDPTEVDDLRRLCERAKLGLAEAMILGAQLLLLELLSEETKPSPTRKRPARGAFSSFRLLPRRRKALTATYLRRTPGKEGESDL
jgi:hypothetical protein